MDDQSTPGASSATTQRATLPDLLTQAYDCFNELGADYKPSAVELQQLQQRLAAGRFHLAVLGQFKRGKSTLLNALLGDDLLPTDILPVTAIPTFIKAGEQLTAKVFFADAQEAVTFGAYDMSLGKSLGDFLAEFVTEQGNPHNQRHVELVEISHPAPLLQQGVVLIDTPGIGSTLKHNTEVAHRILPQCDAALFLVSPDPPITEMELEYLEQIKQKLPRTFYLLNKVDFLDEQERCASLQFLGEQLTPLCEGMPQVMPISARKGLQARLAGDDDGWRQSGMQQVEHNLIDFFAREKQQVLHQALTRKAIDLLNEAVMQVQLSLRALTLPQEELESRLQQFRQSLPAVEREQQAAADILAGDLKRAIAVLIAAIDQLREQAKAQLAGQVATLLETVEDPEELERQVRQTMAAEVPEFFAPALRAVAEEVRREATELFSLNQQRSNRLIEQVRRTAAELFDVPYHAPSSDTAYSQLELPSWNIDLFISDMDPIGQRLSRKLFTKKYRRKRTVDRLREECRKLISQNVELISYTLRRSLEESFRSFGSDLKEQLEKTIVAIRSAMEVALQRSESQARETAAQEIRLKQGLVKLEQLLLELDAR